MAGHNHIPFLATRLGCLYPHDDHSTFRLPENEKAYVCIGSVGQPRDRDSRASFVTIDGNQITYHRIEYDIAATQDKIMAVGLPEFLAERLSRGDRAAVERRAGLFIRDKYLIVRPTSQSGCFCPCSCASAACRRVPDMPVTVVRFGAMGDQVMLTTLLRHLAMRSGERLRIAASGGWTRPLFQAAPWVDEVALIGSRNAPYIFRRDQWALVHWLKQRSGPIWLGRNG